MSAFVGTLPQWISAAAAATGIWIALTASKAWKNTLHAKRGDDLLTALFDFSGEVGATASAIRNEVSAERYGERIDNLFASLRNLQKAFVVAQRSYDLDEAKLSDLRAMVDRTADVTRPISHPGAMQDVFRENVKLSFENLQREVGAFRDYVRSFMQ